MVERVLKRGSWVFSSTMDDVPMVRAVSCPDVRSRPVLLLFTELDYDGEVALHGARRDCTATTA